MASEFDYRRIVQRAHALVDIERYGDAIVLFENALSLEPEDPHVLTSIACTLRLAGDRKGARTYAERALRSDPEFSWAYRELALLRLDANDARGAYKLATTGVRLSPEDVAALHVLGCCAFSLERNEEVRAIAERILDAAPDEIEGHNLLALVADEEGAVADTVRHLQKVLEIDPENASAIERLANAQRRLRQADVSTTYYSAALHADPGDREVQSSLKDSLHRFALFGERNHRLRSPAAWLGTLTVVYLFVFWVLSRLVFEESTQVWLNRFGVLVMPALAVVLVLLARRRFIARRFPELAAGYRLLGRETRRAYWIGVPIVLVCVFGASLIMIRAGVPLVIALAPVWLPVAGIWVALLLLVVGVLRALVTDWAIRDRSELADVAATVARWGGVFDTALGLVLFVAAAVWQSALAFLGAVLIVMTAILAGYRQRPLRMATLLLVLGLSITTVAERLPAIMDLEPRLLGFLICLVALALFAKAIWLYGSRWWQRRRIARTLATRPETE